MFSGTISTSHQFAHQAIPLLEAMTQVLIAQVSFAYNMGLHLQAHIYIS